jgi:uncharacterized SAM-binding protein YcdF (DUF218 family)
VKRTLRYLLPTAVVLALAAVLSGDTLLAALGSYLVKAEAPRKADIAIVLAGDVSGGRIIRAGELVREGYVPRALVSGPEGVYGYHECDLAIPFAVKSGFPENYFLHFENEAHSTAEEAQAAALELRRLGAHNVLVVTTDYHTRRSGRAYRKAAPDLNFTVVAAPDQYFTAKGWWRNREGQKTMVYESLKTVASWLGI